MAGISKDMAGVEALNSLGNALLQELENINSTHDKLKQAYESVKSEVAHEAEIEEILEEVRVTQAGVSSSVATLSQKVHNLAKKLEAFISGGLGGSGN